MEEGMTSFSRRMVLGLGSAALLTLAATSAMAAERAAFDRSAFDKAVAAGGPVLVDVYAPWCSTCRAQSKALDGLFKGPEYAAYQVFVVDYDSEKDVMRSFGASQRSTLIVFAGGSEKGRIVGDTSPAAIEALLQAGL
jgi:thioredoxin-like negative regulator of GroEL